MRRRSLLALTLALAAWPVFAADGPQRPIVYTRKDGDRYVLHLMKADGTDDQVLPGQTAAVNLFPTWSPDGKRIAFMSGEKLQGDEYQVAVINADGTGLKTLTLGQKTSGLPAWSPDGKQLAFIGGGDQAPGIFIADPDGGGLRQINPEGTGGFFPFWSRDGKKIGYSRAEPMSRKSQIVLQSLDGGGTETIGSAGESMAFAGANALSPDGKRLLFASVDFQNKSVSLRTWDFGAKAEAFLGDAVEIGNPEGPQSFPSATWAPDGKSFLVNLPSAAGFGLFRVSEDGKTRTRVTPEGVECFGAAWFGGS